MRDIIVGVDAGCSETARAAVATAAELAQLTGQTLHLVSGVPKSEAEAGSVSAGGERWFVDNLETIKQRLQDLARELGHADADCHALVGDAAKVLADEAERLEASIIVVGNRRTQGMSRVLGSVASDVLKVAPCHVLVANTTR